MSGKVGSNPATASGPPSFTELNDLSSEDIGGRIIFATDDWFAGQYNYFSFFCYADNGYLTCTSTLLLNILDLFDREA